MYTLRVPFAVPASQRIDGASPEFDLDSLRVVLSGSGQYYRLEVIGFETPQAAAEFLPRVFAGLARLLLERGLVAHLSFELQPLRGYAEDAQTVAKNVGLSEPVDAVVHDDAPVVYLTGKRLAGIRGMPVNLVRGLSNSLVVQTLADGMRLQNASTLFNDERLRTALELYGSTFSETLARANFISLVMALEAMAERQPRPASVRLGLRVFATVVRLALRFTAAKSDEHDAFTALLKELDFRTKDPIRGSVRRLVQTSLADAADVQDVTRSAIWIYDKRSRLVHEGSLPEGELRLAVDQARVVVKRVVEARIRTVSGS